MLSGRVLSRRRTGGVLAMIPVLMLAVLAGCADGPALQVSEARVRQVIPGQDKTVGYFTVRNAGETDRVLSAVASEAVRAIEMHVTVHDGDVARMRRLPEVVIPAGETVRFEPGGRHLMLFGVTELGDTVQLVLSFRVRGAGVEAASATETLPVRFDVVPVGTG